MGIDCTTYVYVGARVELDEFFTKEERSLNCTCGAATKRHKYCPECGERLGLTEVVRIPKFPDEFGLRELEELGEDAWSDYLMDFDAVNEASLHLVSRHSSDDGKWILGVQLRDIDSGLRGWSNEHCAAPAMPLHEIMSAFSKVEGLLTKYSLSTRDIVMIVAPYVSY